MTLRATVVALALLMGVTAAKGATTATPQICSDPQLPKPMSPAACRIEPVLYKFQDAIGSAELIAIGERETRESDLMRIETERFLRLRNGDIVPLGSFPQANSAVNQKVYQLLELRAANLRLVGHNGQTLDGSLFYDRIIDLDSEARCVLFRLKPPFMGELRDCKGRYNSVEGIAGYPPGVASVTSAIQSACARTETETPHRCEKNGFAPMGVRIQRQADGELYYLVTLRMQLPDTSELKMSQFGIPAYPNDYDYRVYRVDALGGNTTFVSQSRQDPTPPYTHNHR